MKVEPEELALTITKKMGSATLEVKVADITTLAVDAIVNAANNALKGGGGVDGAIHRAAGPELLEECRQIGGCPTGEARLTNGYQLPARFVIHTAGPVWSGGNSDEQSLLANSYKNSLILGAGRKFKSIAFPAISTGIYGFPQDLAAAIAIEESCNFLRNEQNCFESIIFCCFSEESANFHTDAMIRVIT